MAKIYARERYGDCIGRVENDGKVYDRERYGNCIGRVESDGKVYDRERYGNCIGRVESDGKVYDRERYGNCVGRVESRSASNVSTSWHTVHIHGIPFSITSALSSTPSPKSNAFAHKNLHFPTLTVKSYCLSLTASS